MSMMKFPESDGLTLADEPPRLGRGHRIKRLSTSGGDAPVSRHWFGKPMRSFLILVFALAASVGLARAQASFTSPSRELRESAPFQNLWTVSGTVYNRGDSAGRAWVAVVITDLDSGKVVLASTARVSPDEVGPRSDGIYAVSFGYVGDATRKLNIGVTLAKSETVK